MKLKVMSLILVLTLLITGCSQGSEEVINDQEGTSQTDRDNSSNEEVEVEDVVSESYVYVDAAGREIIFDEAPTKIAVNYLPLWETLIMLDTLPVGANAADNYRATWDPFEGIDLDSVVDLGSEEINLELLAELEPDLILYQVHDVSSYDIENIEKIAPVVIVGPESRLDWKFALREVGKAINKSDKAEEVIADFDATLAEAREKLQTSYEGVTILQMSQMAMDKYYISYRPEFYDKETGLGLNVPEGYTTSTNYEQISMEALVEMNPDFIFVNVFDGDEGMFEEFQENSVWQSLTAVKEGNVYRLDGSGHSRSGLSTVYTANEIIDILLSEQ